MIPSVKEAERMSIAVQLDNLFQAHGFLPFLLLIDQYEASEHYEHCALLLDVVKRHDRTLSDKARNLLEGGIPTRYNDDALRIFRAQFRDTPDNRILAERALAEVPRRAAAIEQVLALVGAYAAR